MGLSDDRSNNSIDLDNGTEIATMLKDMDTDEGNVNETKRNNDDFMESENEIPADPCPDQTLPKEGKNLNLSWH